MASWTAGIPNKAKLEIIKQVEAKGIWEDMGISSSDLQISSLALYQLSYPELSAHVQTFLADATFTFFFLESDIVIYTR